MKHVRQIAVAAMLGIAAAGAAVSPASAEGPDYYVWIWNGGQCDTSTGEWVVNYHVNNVGTMDVTVEDVSTSATAPIEGLVGGTAAPGEELIGSQRLAPGVYYTTLYFTGTWADGTTTGYGWQFAARTLCSKVTPA